MSTPIVACKVYKAAFGDEKAFAGLVDAMEFNMRVGHFLSVPCACKPRCPQPAQAQMNALNTRLTAALLERRKKLAEIAARHQRKKP